MCDYCGRFEISGTALDDKVLRFTGRFLNKAKVIRAALSHKVSRYSTNRNPLLLTSYIIEDVQNHPILPNQSEQANYLINLMGREYFEIGEEFYLNKRHVSLVGCIDETRLILLVKELIENGLIREDENRFDDSSNVIFTKPVHLSLRGWELFEQIKRGKTSGQSGFIAMKFGDKILDPIVSDYIKPSISEHLGLELVDLRDVERAGIIDNIMRQQIRESVFVLVDLTHENAGAYWEAGYAEGLGKPVIYICERDKFNKEKTHFDTNHCTTVMWEEGKLAEFCEQLVATLKRSVE